MPKSENQKQKILFIMDYLQKHSHKDNPVNTSEIIKMLRQEGISADRKSIYSDIKALIAYGLDIVSIPGKTGGYYIASPKDFQLSELKLLVDAVLSSKYLTEKKSRELVHKLCDLCGTDKEAELRDYLIDRILKEIPYTRLNGHRTMRLPNNANFSFQFIEGESLLIMLDMEGICGSSGSACTSGSLDPSHVLLAIGLPHEIAHGSLRLTLSDETTKEDIDFVIEKVKEIVARLRNMSPLYEDFMKKQK